MVPVTQPGPFFANLVAFSLFTYTNNLLINYIIYIIITACFNINLT